MLVESQLENLDGRNYLGDPDVDERIILNWILKIMMSGCE
jgi:hypothetical protein